MEYLTIAWLLLSIPIVLVGGAHFYDARKKDAALSALAATVVLMPVWWAVYFIILSV